MSFRVPNRSGMRRGGSKSELGSAHSFHAARNTAAGQLSTVCCLRRSEIVVLKYVATLNGFMFL